MSFSDSKNTLPENPSLKEINSFKKQLNWGELPPFYHMVASSLGESEGLLTHGFDTALKRIIDKKNWNLELLGGYQTKEGHISCEQKPRIAIYQIFSDRGFELQAFPYAKNKELDQYIKDNRFIEFRLWDPLNMKLILRINQLHKFIDFYFQKGDPADKALIIHAAKIVFGVIEFLKREVNIVKVDGVPIKQYYDLREKSAIDDNDALIIAGLKGNYFDPNAN